MTGNKNLASKVTYVHAATSVVDNITPAFAPSVGGTAIHIEGSGFGTSVQVTIDGIACAVTSQTANEIFCTTGRRASPPSGGNTFVVNSDGNFAKIAT